VAVAALSSRLPAQQVFHGKGSATSPAKISA